MKKIVQDLNTTTARRKNVGRLCFLCVCCPPAKWWAALMACRVREMRHNNVWSSSSDEKKNIKNTSRMLQCFSFCHTQSPCTGVTMMPKSDNRAATKKKKNIAEKEKNPQSESALGCAQGGLHEKRKTAQRCIKGKKRTTIK